MRSAPAAHTLFIPSPTRLSRCSLRQSRHAGMLRSAPIKEPSKSHQRHRVTVAARRDAPEGVGTRNVPEDSPTPPTRVEQGTMSSKPASRAPHPAARQAKETVACRRCTTPRTSPRTAAQPRVRAPRRLCKSVAYRRTHFGPVTVCNSIAHDLDGRSPSLPLHIRRLA
jgi:hypothetical protein